jgi:hypothetical protein
MFVILLPLNIVGQKRGSKITDNTSNTSSVALNDFAILDLDSSQKGFLLPRMTTAQRNAIEVDKLKDQGLAIFNITTDCMEYYNSYIETWVSLCGDTLPAEITILPSQCSEIKVVGEYYQNHELESSNGVIVKVTTSKAGAYHIIARSTNGYSFEAKGRFPSTGTFTVFLKGDGKPKVGYDVNNSGQPLVKGDKLSIEINNKPISCEVYVFVNKDMPIYKITATDVKGRYFTAENVTGEEKINVTVNVERVGRWIMNTDDLTGVRFSGEGVFSSTGIQTIALSSTGKTNKAGDNEVTITTNSLKALGEVGVTTKVKYLGEGPAFNVINCSEAVFSNQAFVNELVPIGTTLKFKVKVLAPAKDHQIGMGYIIIGTERRLRFAAQGVNLNYDRHATGANANIQELTLTVQENYRDHGKDIPTSEELYFWDSAGFKGYDCTTGFPIKINIQSRVEPKISFWSPFESQKKRGTRYLPPYTKIASLSAAEKPYLDVEFFAGGSGSVSVTTESKNGITFAGDLSITDGIAKGKVYANNTGTVEASIPKSESSFTLKRTDTNVTIGNVTVDFVYRQMKLVSYGQVILFGGTSNNGSKNVNALLENTEIFGWDGVVRVDGFKYIDASAANRNVLNSLSSGDSDKLKSNLEEADIVGVFASYSVKRNEKLDILYEYFEREKFALIYADRYDGAVSGGSSVNLYPSTVYFMKKFDTFFTTSYLKGDNASNVASGLEMNSLGGTHYAKLYDTRFLQKYPVLGKSTMVSTRFGLAETGDVGFNSIYFTNLPNGFEALYSRGGTSRVYGIVHNSKGVLFIGNHRPLYGINSSTIALNSPIETGGIFDNEPIATKTYGLNGTKYEVHNAYHFLNMMLWSIDYAQKNRTAK